MSILGELRIALKRRRARSERRVLLALLSGATNLSGYPLSVAAQVGSGKVYVVLARLEHTGLVTSRWQERSDGKPRRRFYSLTPAGREHALSVLGLEDSRG